MSYDANAHAAQMAIMNKLLHVPSAGFAELQKQTGLASDHANFHIKKLVDEGYITKHADGYVLTRTGKEYANRMDTDERVIEKQPKLSVGLIIENDRGEFLAQQRLKQPYYGFWGRPTGKIRWGETFVGAAARELAEETGLTADLRVAGIYHKMDFVQGTDDMLEDKIFILVYGCNPKGVLLEEFEGGRNAWMTDDALLAQETVFESVSELSRLVKSGRIHVVERRYDYDPASY